MDFDDLDEVAPVEIAEDQPEETAASEESEMAPVTLWIPGSNQQLTVPVKKTDTILDAKKTLADMYGVDAPTLHLGEAQGSYLIYYKDHQKICQVKDTKKICLKGIFEFDNVRTRYPHPFCVIGGGHNGCRQAAEYVRRKIEFTLFERKERFGGNAWATIANKQSRLQSEACSYQIQYDPFDGNINTIWKNPEYTGDKDNQWPSRDRILANYAHFMKEYNVPAKLNTNVCKMVIEEAPEGKDPIKDKHYDLHWERTDDDDDEGVYRVSCFCVYPGAMCHPRRHVFPGEGDFDGIIGYGFSNEFPYDDVSGKVGIILGMGAFFAENIRTLCEYHIKKVWGVCRHYNLMCPRMGSWTMSISYVPAPAAEIINIFKPMYELAGLQDPWDWWSISSKNEARTACTIKQYTRWGVGDIYFLAVYFGVCEMITSEIEKLSGNKCKLNTGRTLTGIEYMLKVLGFLSDFSTDKLMQAEKMLGPWPEGDWRRWVLSDQSEIDANRFCSLGLSCGAASTVRQSIWFHEHPIDAQRALDAGVLSWNYAEPELGLTAYHYHPRKGTANMIALGRFTPCLNGFHMENDCFRIALYKEQADPFLFHRACKKDWDMYCDMFQKDGFVTKPSPPYPYTVEMLEGVVERGTEAEQYYLDYECMKKNGKELLGYVHEVEGHIR